MYVMIFPLASFFDFIRIREVRGEKQNITFVVCSATNRKFGSYIFIVLQL